LTKGAEQLTTDTLSRLGADEIAHNLREKYKGNKYFKVAVFMFPHGKAGNFCYVVRTNLINGLPPTKPTEIKIPDAPFLRRATQVAA
jgi:hypothetical protein